MMQNVGEADHVACTLTRGNTVMTTPVRRRSPRSRRRAGSHALSECLSRTLVSGCTALSTHGVHTVNQATPLFSKRFSV